MKIGLANIFNGSSPFDDGGELEVIAGHPEGAEIPSLPDAPQKFSPGLDAELKLTQQINQ
jgi:Mn-containing catalase